MAAIGVFVFAVATLIGGALLATLRSGFQGRTALGSGIRSLQISFRGWAAHQNVVVKLCLFIVVALAGFTIVFWPMLLFLIVDAAGELVDRRSGGVNIGLTVYFLGTFAISNFLEKRL